MKHILLILALLLTTSLNVNASNKMEVPPDDILVEITNIKNIVAELSMQYPEGTEVNNKLQQISASLTSLEKEVSSQAYQLNIRKDMLEKMIVLITWQEEEICRLDKKNCALGQ